MKSWSCAVILVFHLWYCCKAFTFRINFNHNIRNAYNFSCKSKSIDQSMLVGESHIAKSHEIELENEVLSGLVVMLATIPTSIAYSTVVGVSPLIGAWTSIIIGSTVSLVRGGPGVITGAAGVVAVPMGALLASHGSPHMGAALLLAGCLEMLFGVAKLGKFATFITEPVVIGFLNALTLFLIKSQMNVFRDRGSWLLFPQLQAAIITAFSCIAVTHGIPKVAPKIPGSLVGIIFSSFLALGLKFPVKLLSDISSKSTFSGGLNALPVFVGFPAVPLSLQTLKIIVPVAIGAMIISIVETLVSARLVQDTVRKRGRSPLPVDPDRLTVGLGIGNVVASLFGGFGGCGLIPNSVLNAKSGGMGYASPLAYAALSALGVVAFAPVIASIPLAALAGLMFNVAWNIVEWEETRDLFVRCMRSKQDFSDLVGMLVTMGVCYKVDMGLGVVLGSLVVKIPTLVKLLERN